MMIQWNFELDCTNYNKTYFSDQYYINRLYILCTFVTEKNVDFVYSLNDSPWILRGRETWIL